MRKKVLAAVLTVALCTMMMGTTVLAASSSSSGSSSSSSGSSSSGDSGAGGSGSQTSTPEATIGTVNTDAVEVATVAPDGSVSKVNLTKYTQQVNNTVVAVAAAASGSANAGEAVSAVLSAPASDVFKATINALGGNIRLVNAGGHKVATTAADGTGKTIASIGAVRGVTKYAFVILTAVNADGTVEIVEGTVDPVTLQIMGVFTGAPQTITVSVIVAA